jgi:hypothetical protein
MLRRGPGLLREGARALRASRAAPGAAGEVRPRAAAGGRRVLPAPLRRHAPHRPPGGRADGRPFPPPHSNDQAPCGSAAGAATWAAAPAWRQAQQQQQQQQARGAAPAAAAAWAAAGAPRAWGGAAAPWAPRGVCTSPPAAAAAAQPQPKPGAARDAPSDASPTAPGAASSSDTPTATSGSTPSSSGSGVPGLSDEELKKEYEAQKAAFAAQMHRMEYKMTQIGYVLQPYKGPPPPLGWDWVASKDGRKRALERFQVRGARGVEGGWGCGQCLAGTDRAAAHRRALKRTRPTNHPIAPRTG